MMNNPKSRDKELVVQDLSDEILIYDLTIDNGLHLKRNIIDHLAFVQREEFRFGDRRRIIETIENESRRRNRLARAR